MCVYTYIYIYIYRERERDLESLKTATTCSLEASLTTYASTQSVTSWKTGIPDYNALKISVLAHYDIFRLYYWFKGFGFCIDRI